jgi:hypothetical protein
MKFDDIKKMKYEIKDCVSELKYHMIISNRDTLLSDLHEKLVKREYKLDRMKNRSGINYIESERIGEIDEYVKVNFVAFVKETVEDSVNGLKQEVMYTKEYSCDLVFFKKFMVSFGAKKAIDHATKNIANWFAVGFEGMPIEDNIMNKLPDFFETIYMVDGKDIDHSDIKAEKVRGQAKDVQDLIPYSHNINSLSGFCKTPVEEIKMTIKKAGKIKFHTKKETNIFTGHVMYGYCLITGEDIER